MPVRVQHWDPAWGALNEKNMRRWLERQGYAVSRYVYPPGTCFSDHTHEVDKKDTVLSGRLKIAAEGQEFVLAPGDIIEIPAHVVQTRKWSVTKQWSAWTPPAQSNPSDRKTAG